MDELVVRRRGGKACPVVRIWTQYAEVLEEGGSSRLERNVVDIPGYIRARKKEGMMIPTKGLLQGKFECVNEHGYAKGIVNEDGISRCFVEYAFGGTKFAAGGQPMWACPRRSLIVCDARSGMIATVSCRRKVRAWQR